MNFTRNICLSLVFLSLISQSSFAKQKKTTCFPQNRLFLKDDPSESNITEAQFNQIIDKIVAYYKPIVKEHGHELVAIKNWKNGTVNAYAAVNETTKNWEVNFFGGLARRPEVTPDGFALIVCHEIGHHLAGYPFYEDWGSSEGQADYFATQACAKAGWGGNAQKNLKSKKLVDSVAKEECDIQYITTEKRALCYREMDAAYAVAGLFSVLNNDKTTPEFDTPDKIKVTETNPSYGSAQCRLDTYFHGSLCTKTFDDSIIPGLSSKGGSNTIAAEKIAGKNSCMSADGFEVGFRPRCWFKPLIKN
ncbi:MAG: hypothetical protein KA715_12985 [Xanthomonadaceae bacterium]|nr:hypothetical protein [Xanthomonadaceae bacterium]